MKRGVRNLLSLGFVGLFLLGGYACLSGRGSAIFDASAQVTGVVVDARTGRPIEGATVYVLRGASEADAQDDLAELRDLLAEHPEPPNDVWWCGSRASTGSEGRFTVLVHAWFCTPVRPFISEKRPPPFHGVGMTVVEAEGYEQAWFSARSGTYEVVENRSDADPYARIDARTLRLPRAK